MNDKIQLAAMGAQYRLTEEQAKGLAERMPQTGALQVIDDEPLCMAKRIEELEAQVRALTAPEGWQLVPVEPTPEMILAGVAAQAEKLKRYALGGSLHPIDHGMPDAYRAMLAAAPKPEAK